MFDKKKKDKKPDRFIVKEMQEIVPGYFMEIVVDGTTGVNYLCSGEFDGEIKAITPLLDNKGKVVIDAVEIETESDGKNA